MGLFDKLFGPPGKDAFARRLLEALRRAGHPAARYDRENFKIVLGGDRTMYLANAYAEYCAVPKAHRPALLERYARVSDAPPIPERFDEALPCLRPRVRERFFYDATRLQMHLQGQKAPEFVFRPFADHYAVELGYDLPDSVMMVGASELTRWGVPFEEALEKSWANLRAVTDRPLAALRPGLYASEWHDAYDASRALLLDFILGHKVSGEPVVAIPNRDTLLVTGSRDAAGLSAMAELADRALSQPRPMAGVPLVLSERSYAAWLPEPGHPSHGPLKLLTLKTLAGFYAEQKEILDALHERSGEDVFVASLTLTREEKTGAYGSYCVWSEGVVTLLPEAERVFFMRAGPGGAPDPKAEPVIAAWPRVREVAGDLMTPAEGYPPRYRVDRFPSPAELGRLRTRAGA